MGPVGTALQITRAAELARQSHLISSGRARKPLFVSSAYFRKPRRVRECGPVQSAAVSPRFLGILKNPSIPSQGAHRGSKNTDESGSSIYNAVYKAQ